MMVVRERTRSGTPPVGVPTKSTGGPIGCMLSYVSVIRPQCTRKPRVIIFHFTIYNGVFFTATGLHFHNSILGLSNLTADH